MSQPPQGSTALGLRLLAGAVVVLLLLALVAIAAPFGAMSQDTGNAVMLWCGVAAQLLALAGLGLCLAGLGLCLAGPDRGGDKAWLIAAAVLFGLALAAGLLQRPLLEMIVGWGGLGLALLMAVYFGVMSLLVQMAGLGLFLVWLRSLAQRLGDEKRARHALDLIKTGTAITLLFVGTFAWIFLRPAVQPQAREIDTVGFVLYLCIPGALVGMLIWMGSLAGVQFGLASRLQAGPDHPPDGRAGPAGSTGAAAHAPQQGPPLSR